MSNKWTDEQLSAINTRNKSLLVSAAAGSGKTATLTERIISSLLDPDNSADISKMLVVTFTRAAAAELRERISLALSDACEKNPDNATLRRQLLYLPSAKISTIDSFCADIVRQNATSVDIRPDFRVCDQNERALLCRDIMENLVEECYGAGDGSVVSVSEFCHFADSIASAKQGEGLSDALLLIYEKTTSHPKRTDALLELRDNFLPFRDFLSTRCGALIKGELALAFEHYEKIYTSYIEEISQSGSEKIIQKHLPSYEGDLRFIATMRSCLEKEDYTAVRSRMKAFEKISLGTVRGEHLEADTQMRRLREEFWKYLSSVLEKYFSYSESELQMLQDKAYSFCSVMHKVLCEFEGRFLREKRRRGICDYGDLEHYALQILYDGEDCSEVAKSLQSTFDYVYIDEYQDVNAVQHAIFSAVSREDNCFMVGDIKQSIYSFRHAEPDIFAEMKKSLPKLTDAAQALGAGIFMSKNFRCDETVVNFVNAVFNRVFAVAGESIGYESGDALQFAKRCPDAYTGALPEIYLIAKESSKDNEDEDEDDGDIGTAEDEQAISEAEFVAKKIKELLDTATLANGKKVKPSDVAILLRAAKSKASVYAEALKKNGIPCDNNEQQSFFESPEILLMLCILNTIDNPQKDVYLAGALHSPVYSFSLDELIEIRLFAGARLSLFDALCVYCEQNPDFEKGKSFLFELERFRLKSRGCPVDRLIEYIYNETGILSLYGKNSEMGHSRLLCLYNHARTFEASSFRGLYNFVQYVNEIIERKGTFAEPDKRSGDGVQIMTIHHSKGLEFPVCFVCDCSYNLTPQDLKQDMIFDKELGVSLKYLCDGDVKAENPIRYAMSRNVYKNAMLEELRVLYVALTRARERLFITGKATKKTRDFVEECMTNSRFLSMHSVLGMHSNMKVVLSSVLGECEACAKIFCVDEKGNEIPLTEYLSVQGDEGENEEAKEAKEAQPSHECDTASECDTDTQAPQEKEKSPQDDFASEIKKRFEYEYPYEKLSSIPAKLSVSRLYPDVLDDIYDNSLSLSDAQEGEKGAPSDTQDETAEHTRVIEPRFISLSDTDESDASKRGIATHLFMQFADFASVKKNGARAELASLVERGFISQKDADIVYADELELFEGSLLLSELLSARQVRRELRFNILLDASDFSKNEELSHALDGEKLLVQGVIDCIIENEDGSYYVVDYKTDRLSDYEKSHKNAARATLAQRHSRQLEYYKQACERIYGKEPKKVMIYSLPLGDTVEIEQCKALQ